MFGWFDFDFYLFSFFFGGVGERSIIWNYLYKMSFPGDVWENGSVRTSENSFLNQSTFENGPNCRHQMEPTRRNGELCLSLRPLILMTGDLQKKSVPFPSGLHIAMAQGSEKLKGESPWELEALQSWWLNNSDKVSQHTITGYKLFMEYNEGSVTVTHVSWPTLTQNHTRKEILGTSIQSHKHPRWPRKGWYPLFLLPSSGPCSIILDAAGLTLSLCHPPVHHS